MPPKVNFHWLSEAWALFMAQAGVWIGATALIPALAVVCGGVMFFGGLALGAFSPNTGHADSTGFFVSVVVLISVSVLAFLYGTLFLSCGLHLMAVKQVRGRPIAFRDVFTGRSLFWRMLLFNAAYGLVTTVGTLLCVLPGLYAGGVLLAAPALVADGAGVREAFAKSHAATTGDWLNATLLFFVLQLIVSVGASVGVGLLIALPLCWLVSALAHRDLIETPQPPALSAPAAPGDWPPPPAFSSPDDSRPAGINAPTRE